MADSKRWTVLLILVLMMTMVSPSFAEQQQPYVGIVQLAEHPSLDAARLGFMAALEDNGYEEGVNLLIDYRNAQGSQDILSAISDHFIAQQVDLVLAIATSAAQAIAGKTETIPILGSAITDYVAAGLVMTNEVPGYNVSGTTDMNPVKDQIALIKRFLPDAARVALMYTSSEANSVVQAAMAQEYIEELGMEYVEVTVNNSNDVQQAAQSLVGRVDAVYIPTDNVMASTVPIISEVLTDAGIPLFCAEESSVKGGGTATLGINYYNLGYQTGLMAIDVLKGGDISQMAIQAQTEYEYAINKASCDALGLTIPEDLLPYILPAE
ncbi:MAG: ABC transporter substrate-binding protein [Eubacteriales bacterium]|nr:ABC transporter substrate-binding protein [Eubacteriales bacterium]MDD4105725.1 ABC transporter substrate-binding protein [Eubacteriales bacterium]NLO15925.1 ABC transporter substrate-binding protein [Clostridiales bacterium]